MCVKMREILFRGQCCTDGKWVEGYLGIEAPDELVIQQFSYDEYFKSDCIDQYSVKPETIGQYTGLTDKNGVKIFEGDIVDVNNALLRGRFWVEYEESGGTFIVKDKNDRRYFLGGCNCTVIGNIYDNPELMGG